jgi:hypothetical protein
MLNKLPQDRVKIIQSVVVTPKTRLFEVEQRMLIPMNKCQQKKRLPPPVCGVLLDFSNLLGENQCICG